MQDMAIVLFLGVGLIVAGLVVRMTRQELRKQLRRMPRTLVREAHEGPFVKMAGRLTARTPVRSPLADVDCAYFEMTVSEKLDTSDEGMTVLFTDKQYASGWALEDETGRIEVEAEDAVGDYLLVREYSPGVAWDPRLQSELLARYINARNGRSDTPMLLHEERLEVGSSVVVFGWLRKGPEGLVLTGGSELRVLGESEQHLLRFRALDLVAWVLLLSGALVAAASVAHVFEEPAPPPNLEMTPLPRPPPGPQLPR